MAYTTPKKVFLSMERFEWIEETFTSVSSGDTLELANPYPVQDTVTVVVDGNVQSDTDYTIDFELAEVTYNGTDTGDASVEYGSAPYSDTAVQQSISAVEEHIDDFTNSTYDGLETVTDELYDGNMNESVYVLAKRPVRSISKVALNTPDPDESNPTYKEIDEGLANEYIEYKTLGFRFTEGGVDIENEPEYIQVSYDYGYSDVPADLEKAATEMVVEDLVFGTVSGAMVDGRDNFDPQTVDVNRNSYQEVLERYRIYRMENFNYLAVEGSIS